MEYQIPKGFEDFVSNAETLLGQFDSFPSSSALDVVVYSVFVLHEFDNERCYDQAPSEKDLQYLLQLCTEINDYASSIYKDYIWYMDTFRLYVIKVRKDPHV